MHSQIADGTWKVAGLNPQFLVVPKQTSFGAPILLQGTESGLMAMSSLECKLRGFALSRSPITATYPRVCDLRRVSVSGKRGGILLPIRASSSGENVLPVDRNGVATLESLLDVSPKTATKDENGRERLEALIERVIFNCRFLTLMAVAGSLAGSLLCFFKGSLFVSQSFVEYFQASWQGLGTSQVVFLLVEAVDVYLMGTVMLIFGMGLYELFVSALDVPGDGCAEAPSPVCGSNLFGLFRMRERPKWLEIRSLDELKTKLGHVIVMILLVGMFEKSKKVPINSGLDLLCFSASILLSSGCLFLLSKLHSNSAH